MNYYQEVTLLPQAEVGTYAIWPKLYTQLHLALVEINNVQRDSPVGVSFPLYKFSAKLSEKESSGFLGNKLRVFAKDEATLMQLDLAKWLHRLQDYVHTTQIRGVPENFQRYLCFSRLQVQSSVQRLARRKAKRESISVEEALTRLDGFKEKELTQPFLNLGSLSGGQRFQLFIGRRELPNAEQGTFSSYGLSTTATVPDF